MASGVSSEGITREFVDLLKEMKLLMPDALAHEDWLEWNRAAQTMKRLKTLLDEARPALQSIQSGLISPGPGGLSHVAAYTRVQSPTLHLLLGF